MLYALASPVSFVLLLAGYLLAVTLGGYASRIAAGGRSRPDPRQQLDPFGSVAALIAGFGWWRPVEMPRLRGVRLVVACLAGPAVVLAVALLALSAFGLTHGSIGAPLSALLQGGGSGLPLVPLALLLIGAMHLYVGLLALVPLPPLPGARLLFGLAPRTSAWQKAEYHLAERNIGVVVLLVLMLVPLGGPSPLLPTVLDSITGGPLRQVTGG